MRMRRYSLTSLRQASLHPPAGHISATNTSFYPISAVYYLLSTVPFGFVFKMRPLATLIPVFLAPQYGMLARGRTLVENRVSGWVRHQDQRTSRMGRSMRDFIDSGAARTVLIGRAREITVTGAPPVPAIESLNNY
jgi:hypothetical protein